MKDSFELQSKSYLVANMNTVLISILFLSTINISSSQVVRVREGKKNKEFKTIQACVDSIKRSWKATCKIRAGVYEEQINIIDKKDITIPGVGVYCSMEETKKLVKSKKMIIGIKN